MHLTKVGSRCSGSSAPDHSRPGRSQRPSGPGPPGIATFTISLFTLTSPCHGVMRSVSHQ
eukprot:7328231-Pyramimonas_sp.AAC.1